MGLIVIFRDRHNYQGRLTKFLSDNAFGVYVFHAPILISISLLFRGISMYPVLKFLFIAAIALPICFLISSIIRKVPVLKKVFS
jgi:surface polysaccharide O-acyltransferase-like enzyme